MNYGLPAGYDSYRFGPADREDDREDVICDCRHTSSPDKAVEREDGFIACGDCAKSLDGFEAAFGEEAEIYRDDAQVSAWMVVLSGVAVLVGVVLGFLFQMHWLEVLR